MSEFQRVEVPSYPVSIFVAGPVSEAESICAQFCLDVGLCVTVTPTEYVYTGGRESGVCVGLINYPRFMSDPEEIFSTAEALARRLVRGMHQHSATIQAPDRTLWISRRDQEARNG